MAIGLDIGSSAVRAVQLQKRRGGALELRSFGEVELPPGAVVDGDVVDAEVVSGALKRLWAQTRLRRRTVAVGVASQRVTVRPIDLPELPAAELDAAVRLQAQDELPMPLDQAVFGHVEVNRYVVGEDRRNVRLLLVAAEQEMVERLLAALGRAKLRAVLVDLGAFALLRSVATPTSPAGEEEAELVVDVGATVTKIAVHRGGAPLFVRMVRLGGDTLTRQLQDALELSWEEAEQAKLSASAAMAAGADLDDEDERVRILRAGSRRMVSEIRHSLEFFRSQQEIDLRRVLLSGGASLTANLDAELGSALELPVGRGDPLGALHASKGRGTGLEHKRPFLAVPVGLAMGLLR